MKVWRNVCHLYIYLSVCPTVPLSFSLSPSLSLSLFVSFSPSPLSFCISLRYLPPPPLSSCISLCISSPVSRCISPPPPPSLSQLNCRLHALDVIQTLSCLIHLCSCCVGLDTFANKTAGLDMHHLLFLFYILMLLDLIFCLRCRK